VIRSEMLLATLSVFSTLIGASVAAGASVGASVTGASGGASVACGPAGAAGGTDGLHAVRITSAIEIKIIEILGLD